MTNENKTFPLTSPVTRPTDAEFQKGYQPGKTLPQGGHQPSTNQGLPVNLPNQDTGGKK